MKNQILELIDVLLASFKSTFSQIGEGLPTLLGALAILILGWLISKFIATIIGRVLKAVNFDSLTEKLKLDSFMEKANISISPVAIIKKFVFWFLFLVFLIAAIDKLGITAISTEMEKIIAFLPKIFIAVVIMLVGIYIANIIKDLLVAATGSLGLAAGKLISNLAYYFLLFIVIMTALSQTGIDLVALQGPFFIIFASFAIAGAISYAIASHEIMRNILSTFFSKNQLSVGQTIKIGDTEGTITKMNNISITIQNAEGDEVIVPSKMVISEKVTIKKS